MKTFACMLAILSGCIAAKNVVKFKINPNVTLKSDDLSKNEFKAPLSDLDLEFLTLQYSRKSAELLIDSGFDIQITPRIYNSLIDSELYHSVLKLEVELYKNKKLIKKIHSCNSYPSHFFPEEISTRKFINALDSSFHMALNDLNGAISDSTHDIKINHCSEHNARGDLYEILDGKISSPSKIVSEIYEKLQYAERDILPTIKKHKAAWDYSESIKHWHLNRCEAKANEKFIVFAFAPINSKIDWINPESDNLPNLRGRGPKHWILIYDKNLEKFVSYYQATYHTIAE